MTLPTSVPPREAIMWDTEGLTAVTRPGLYANMPDETYHADPVAGRSLSSSGARRLLPPNCPARFHWEQENGRASKAAFDFGHAAHKRHLGVGPPIAAIDADDWRTKAAKEQRDEAYAAGRVPLLVRDAEIIEAMAAALAAHPIAQALFKDGEGMAEASMFWRDAPTGIIRRSRMDWLRHSIPGMRDLVVDYKSTKSAEPASFAKDAMNYGYHQQAAWYLDGVIELGLAAEPAFIFCTQEKVAPYLVSVVELDPMALRIGRHLNRKALDLYAECVAKDYWPGYTDEVEMVGLPGWYENSMMEEL